MTSQPPPSTIEGRADGLEPDPALPPTELPAAERERESRWTLPKILLWSAIALLGGVAWVMLAIVRGEAAPSSPRCGCARAASSATSSSRSTSRPASAACSPARRACTTRAPR